MRIDEAETRLGLKLPLRHREALLDLTNPIHDACDFLLLESPHPLLRIVDVNEDLHDPGRWNRWPEYLVGFASNGCGDYFAYDARSAPYRIHYIDPLETVEESITRGEAEGFTFADFDAWHRYLIESRSRRRR